VAGPCERDPGFPAVRRARRNRGCWSVASAMSRQNATRAGDLACRGNLRCSLRNRAAEGDRSESVLERVRADQVVDHYAHARLFCDLTNRCLLGRLACFDLAAGKTSSAPVVILFD
jgi:hypothetical protein